MSGGSSAAAMEKTLKEMNESFAGCLALVVAPVEYPPPSRPKPLQQDATDLNDQNELMSSYFAQAKKLELLLLAQESHEAGETRTQVEAEIQALEHELSEKNDLIDKYSEVIRGWEGKFKRLDSKMSVS
ncbi:unnamed protein product [Aphanomyces euteiches]|uniref:Uncharacterized protein n=1 Tax=Aphanomyces euteiches TaxID=100861 RepID=A0A6G0WIF2_9STRA|nr:hypothetical protein Ae201684_014963 [Aphanomyces euteiches]KAH9076627.1 hypothetical protein Ae201684P_010567 [Aphanomyces euteiches]KAH9136931.1 hypothetical protein AeRB84_018132 [Aphanomyces euteiches]